MIAADLLAPENAALRRTQAISAASKGYAVFPVHVAVDAAGTKRVQPVGPWREISTSDVSQVISWWDGAHGDCLVGIDCGKSRVAVVDQDVKHGLDGPGVWKSMSETYPYPAYTVTTQSGGKHQLYSDPNGTAGVDSSGKIGPGVDVRGVGGFIIAWSMSFLKPTELPLIPAIVVERVPAGAPKLAATTTTMASGPSDPFATVARLFTHDEARNFFAPHLSALVEAKRGTINNMLNTAATVLYHFVPGLITREAADATLLEATRSACERNGTPNDPVKDRVTLDSAWSGSRRDWLASAKVADQGKGDAPAGQDGEPGAEDDERADEGYEPIEWESFFATDLTVADWLSGRLVQRGRQAALVGEAKAGKSLFCLEWACAMAAGKPFLHDGARTPVTVLYVDQENSPADIQMRLRALGYGPGDLARLRYMSFPPMAPLDTKTGAARLVHEVERLGAEVVFLDTISRMIEGKENDSDPWLALYRMALKPLKALGVTTIRLDHFGKSAANGARGSSAKTGDVDEVWELRSVADGGLALARTYTRTGMGEGNLAIERTGKPGEVGTTKHLATIAGGMIIDETEAENTLQSGEVYSEGVITLISVFESTFMRGTGNSKGEVKAMAMSKDRRRGGKAMALRTFQRSWGELDALGFLVGSGSKITLAPTEDRPRLYSEYLAKQAADRAAREVERRERVAAEQEEELRRRTGTA